MFFCQIYKKKRENTLSMCIHIVSVWLGGRSNIIFHLGREGGGGSWFLYEKCKKGGGGGVSSRPAIHSDFI